MTRSPPAMSAAHAAWTAQAAGSTMTASSSERSSGTSCSWLSCATSPLDRAPGVAAVAGLQSRAQVAEGDPLARALATRGAARARGVDPAGRAAEHRFDDGPSPLEGAGVHVADHLVARDEGEADDLLEVPGAAAVQGGEVGAADAGQAGPHVDPARTGEGERLELDQLERAHAHALA